MKLIAGLGNPGQKYINSRHNIGFRVTDKLVHKYNATLKRKFLEKVLPAFGFAERRAGRQASLSISGEDVLVVQPLTYMNLSGNYISYLHKRLSLNLKDIFIICDDINLPIGKIRIRPSGSAGGHNGLASIINSLGSEEFPRLRIGIRTGKPIRGLSEYVLSEFEQQENIIIEQIIDNAVSACESWAKDSIEATMNKFNQ